MLSNLWQASLMVVFLLGTAVGLKAQSGPGMNGNWQEKTATRERFCLNGEWDFHPLPGTSHEDWQAPPAPGEVDT
jgi:hypothetical protein